MIKKLAVTPVAISVRRSDLLALKQADGETVQSFHARIRGKAATCAYSIDCPSLECTQTVHFTDIIIKDVLISGLSDEEIKIEVFGWHDLDQKTVDQTVQFIEAKEMARNALTKTSTMSAISTYKKAGRKRNNNDTATRPCKGCSTRVEKLVWSRRQKKMVERNFCGPCWTKQVQERQKQATVEEIYVDTGAIAIGAVSSTPLDHLLIDDSNEWKSAQSLKHPLLSLTPSVNAKYYATIKHKTPSVDPFPISVVTDTGAQSCLWGMKNFLQTGFTESDLIPVKHSLYAANKEKIQVSGAILLRLSGTEANGRNCSAAVMTYISPSTNRFYLSREALVQLDVISSNFELGATQQLQQSVITKETKICGCPNRELPPPRPEKLPFESTPSNNEKMRNWLIDYYSTSTFYQCTHQLLPGMTGPKICLHVDNNAIPYAVHTPAPVSLHWQVAVKEQIDQDISIGVLEKVPIGEPSLWCHRMAITPKSDGSPRRTVDLSPLNAFCVRETHHVQPPFKQAKKIPPNTWKSVTDAWNGFHSVPIRPEDRQYTTIITPWGRYRYRVAPQGFLASGDRYTRRFVEIIADVQRKTKCVDDTLMWDDHDDLCKHWWRVIDFLALLGKNGIVLNILKFQFARKSLDFAGFNITENSVKPMQ